MKIKGIHHISNIVNHPQENIEFYTSLLGLRLLKKAVNFDDAKTYHFYYSNHNGDLGTVITSFPLGQDAKDGKKGGGQAVSTYYIIPEGSYDFWLNR
ncbi:VOC family protein, partial [Haploplasma modicum]|uniref:VOC family protein n=1 Tax=Haploplasma modicum TaxID=2150 RepID=UPI00214CAAE9